MRRFYCSRDAIICISHYTKTLLLEKFPVTPECVFVVHNGLKNGFRPGIDRGEHIRKRWEIPDSSTVLLTLARLVPRKGQDTVIRALPQILRERANVVYICAGIGEYKKRLVELAKDCGVLDRVVFPGLVPVNEKYSYYDACDLFVMPSREYKDTVEGFGLSFVEAWHTSTPVLGGRHGGITEVIEDGVDGAIVDSISVQAVAERILSLVSAPAQLEAMGRRGQAKAQTIFNHTSMADLVADCVRSIVKPMP